MSQRVIVFDTTLRDGEQTPGVNLNISEKVTIAQKLEKLGVDVIEAGFPATSPGDFESVKRISAAVNCGVAALARVVPVDINKAWEAVKDAKKPRIHVFIATSPIHMKYKLRMTEDEVVEHAVKGVKLAKSYCEDVEFSPEDASRSDREFLRRVLTAVIEAGATTINIPDTVGYAMPDEFAGLIAYLKENVPGIENTVLSVHCHNDLGLASANTLAGLLAGARQFECTINGIGERAGNTSLEEVAMAIRTRPDFLELETGINCERIYRTSSIVASMTGVPLPVCKAVVGENAFSHEAGIHQHGMLANARTYEIMTPASIGKNETDMVLGKHSGRHAFALRLSELGFALAEEDIDELFVRFKELADRKKHITDRDLETLARHKAGSSPNDYTLDSFQLQSGNKIRSIASVTLLRKGVELTEAAIGDGPVDASYKAVERIVGGSWPLASYNIRAVTEGEDALGEVTVRVQAGSAVFTGKGLASDIIEASIRAYVNAIDRALAEAPEAYSVDK